MINIIDTENKIKNEILLLATKEAIKIINKTKKEKK